jgi:hypothetical protein
MKFCVFNLRFLSTRLGGRASFDPSRHTTGDIGLEGQRGTEKGGDLASRIRWALASGLSGELLDG